MTPTMWLLVPLCALVAAAYAAVGLGGGTGYLALMTLFGIDTQSMPSTALMLNVVVTGAALLRFGVAGRLRTDLLAPFLVTAIPSAFVGGLIDAPRRAFLLVLAVGLAAAAAAMLKTAASPDDPVTPSRARLWSVAIPAGTTIGLASGFLGIGGGIFLGPLILLLGWAGPREVAAINSATVLILSVAGLTAHGLRGSVDLQIALPLGVAVLVGGLAGAHLAESKLSATTLKRLFAVIVLVAAIRAAFLAFS
ncbi:MAG: sulfite exporter TauE/SafE family protein [Acidobacteria bacterium]|nr:sulfite exporter TauE/SafE family protein [Acidobacteriota bacterium]